jgi:hypothetical protein
LARQIFQRACTTSCGYHFRNPFCVTPKDAPRGASFGACRLFVVLKPFYTKVTLHCRFPIVIELHGSKRTGLHAFLAPDTSFFIDEHDPLIVPEDCFYRTRLLAGRLCAMVAVYGEEIRSVLNHPHQPGAHAEPVFLLARYFTGVASHAIRPEKHQRDTLHANPS